MAFIKTKPTVAKYVVKGPKAKAVKVCTLALRKVLLEELETEIETVTKLAVSDGKKFTHVRGTLSCY